MKNSMVVLALGAIVCALVSPLGAAVWAASHPVCGCSLEVCICPHAGHQAGAARHDHGRHAGARHPAQHARHAHAQHAGRPSTPGSGDASPCHQRTSEHGDADVACTLRSCGSGSMPGTGSIPMQPQGEPLAFVMVAGLNPGGSPSLEDPRLPPDVFPGVESPPPRR